MVSSFTELRAPANFELGTLQRVLQLLCKRRPLAVASTSYGSPTFVATKTGTKEILVPV